MSEMEPIREPIALPGGPGEPGMQDTRDPRTGSHLLRKYRGGRYPTARRTSPFGPRPHRAVVVLFLVAAVTPFVLGALISSAGNERSSAVWLHGGGRAAEASAKTGAIAQASRSEGPSSASAAVRQYVQQYGDAGCTDFASQAEAQYVFELDQIIFGDNLDPDVDGIACDDASYASKEASSQAANRATTTAAAPTTPAEDPSNQASGESILLEAGGPQAGPVPRMPDGSCPPEFPIEVGTGCHRKAP